MRPGIPLQSRAALFFGLAIILAISIAAYWLSGPQAGHVLDEAKIAKRDPNSFSAADEDYFRDMDGGVNLSKEEIQGRNTWVVWTGGNDRFWDELTTISFGNYDLLKVLSSYPGLNYSRDNRWEYFGLVNEPCFQKPTSPNPQRFGLWIDTREANCAPDPFEDERKYPGVQLGARGKSIPAGSFYGYGTGIVGLRLFPNPAFDEAAQKAWDPVRFYTDPSYYNSKDLIRPYRVGMSCGFCHVGPNPVAPPANPQSPKWENLSSTVGAQYFWVDRIFSWKADQQNYFFQLFHTSRPGSLDTSLVSTDYINNPRTMNAVYNLEARLSIARDRGKETLSDGNLDSKQFNNYLTNGPLTEYFDPPATVWTPHVLKDGADSIGTLGALNRVYLNIGLFSEEWLLHFNAVVGGEHPTPIKVRDARHNSTYWDATEAQTPGMALFLLKAGYPHRLADAPGGVDYLQEDQKKLALGKVVFAERCARCHSSKYPRPPVGADPADCSLGDYLRCWNAYWAWTKTDDFKSQMRQIVRKEDFLDNNFLSNDMRVPVSLLQTNLCSPLASNAIGGNIWEDFSSQTYKDLPSVGEVTIYNPITGEPQRYSMPAGGRGYTRPASLVSLWSTAPSLLNNTVGRFEPEPSVAARMRSFDDSIRQMLWPERRNRDAKFDSRLPGEIDRLLPAIFRSSTQRYSFTGTTSAGDLIVTDVKVASPLTTFSAGASVSGLGVAPGSQVVFFDAANATLRLDRPANSNNKGAGLEIDSPDAGIRIGPIPAGTPVGLLSNLELSSETNDISDRVKHDIALLRMLLNVKHDAHLLDYTTDQRERDNIYNHLQGELFNMSKCPDLIVNRGHYFGTDQFPEEPGLTDTEKEGLIAFLKTF